MRAKWLAAVAVTTTALTTAGCGGESGHLRSGTYEYELTKQYLMENGIERAQAAIQDLRQ